MTDWKPKAGERVRWRSKVVTVLDGRVSPAGHIAVRGDSGFYDILHVRNLTPLTEAEGSISSGLVRWETTAPWWAS